MLDTFDDLCFYIKSLATINSNNIFMPHRILSIQQAARRIRISERELMRLVQQEEVPFKHKGDEITFEHRLLDEWAQRRILGLHSDSLTKHHRSAIADRTKDATNDTLMNELCHPKWINPKLTSRTKPGVIRDMVKLAFSTGKLYDEAILRDEIEARENISSTAIGSGAAFLHAQYHDPYHASDSFIVLGKTSQQIFFGAQDGEQTDLFFLICCTDDTLHLHTLARLCMLAHGTLLLSDLRAATTAEQMYQALCFAECELLKTL